MLHETTLQDIDLWEAWIEFDPESDQHFGMLYILGEVPVSRPTRSPRLCRREGEVEAGVLRFDLVTEAAETRYFAEVLHSESLAALNGCKAVRIYRAGELIAEITDLEVLI